MAPYFEEYPELPFGPEARRHVHTRVRDLGTGAGGERRWEVTQVLLDPEGDHLWHVLGTLALDPDDALDGPLVEVLHSAGPRQVGRAAQRSAPVSPLPTGRAPARRSPRSRARCG